MHKLIIKTSQLGHNGKVYEVETNLEVGVEELKKIDNKYGMKYRHQSTDIIQLQSGAEIEGFVFNYKLLFETSLNATEEEWKKFHGYTHHYFANYGNY
jgi:hypothetical protein